MAIDSRRKRASIASLGLPFYGPSIVPDSTLGSNDLQVIGYSYYGIDAGAASVNIGGTGQLEAFGASGTLQIADIIGGSAQIEALTASGALIVGLTIGGTSQLAALSSSGVIDAGAPPETEANTGGWWFHYEQEILKRKDEEEERRRKEEQARQIQDDIERELAQEFRREDTEEARHRELKRLRAIVERHREEVESLGVRVRVATARAVERKTFSAMEALEREIMIAREEELFLLQAVEILLNA